MISFTTMLQAQTPAKALPEFQFFRLDQRAYTNKDLPVGKPLFFVFFDPGCEHCQRTMKWINQHNSLFSKTYMCLVSLEKPDNINRFMATYGPQVGNAKNVVLLQDKLYQFIPKFKPVKYPALFLYSAKKQLLFYDDNEDSVNKLEKAVEKATR